MPDNPPAFPDVRRLELLDASPSVASDAKKRDIYQQSSGMSLRDYFMAHADYDILQQIWERDYFVSRDNIGQTLSSEGVLLCNLPESERFATLAAKYADALLKSRAAHV